MKKFNEEKYLQNYPDVKAAIERGEFILSQFNYFKDDQ
jgi:hypothetical protein